MSDKRTGLQILTVMASVEHSKLDPALGIDRGAFIQGFVAGYSKSEEEKAVTV